MTIFHIISVHDTIVDGVSSFINERAARAAFDAYRNNDGYNEEASSNNHIVIGELESEYYIEKSELSTAYEPISDSGVLTKAIEHFRNEIWNADLPDPTPSPDSLASIKNEENLKANRRRFSQLAIQAIEQRRPAFLIRDGGRAYHCSICGQEMEPESRKPINNAADHTSALPHYCLACGHPLLPDPKELEKK